MSTSTITASIAAFISTISLATAAHAGPSTPAVVTITPSTTLAQSQATQKKMYLAPEELNNIVGRYNTTNGTTMTISKFQNRIYVEADGLAKTELTPVQRHEFIAKYSDVKMRVLPSESGFATNVIVQYTPAKK